jgi:hypothetical protein
MRHKDTRIRIDIYHEATRDPLSNLTVFQNYLQGPKIWESFVGAQKQFPIVSSTPQTLVAATLMTGHVPVALVLAGG